MSNFCYINSHNNIACARACDQEVSEKLSALRKGRGAKAYMYVVRGTALVEAWVYKTAG